MALTIASGIYKRKVTIKRKEASLAPTTFLADHQSSASASSRESSSILTVPQASSASSSSSSSSSYDLINQIRSLPITDIEHFFPKSSDFTQQSKLGNLYEKLWDVVIKTGFSLAFPSNLYDQYEGNINTGKLHKVTDLELYFKRHKILSYGSGGSSDITLRHKTSGKWIFISSKYYMDDSKKSVNDYDVESIVTAASDHLHLFKEYQIYLIVSDREKVEQKMAAAHQTNKCVTGRVAGILDKSDLEKCFGEFQVALRRVPNDQINREFATERVPLTLRFHQDFISHQMMRVIGLGEKEILLGAKPRSGKTYCVGGLISKYYRKCGLVNALIITPAPSETITQFTDDLFHKFRDFIGIKVIEIKSSSDLETLSLTHTTDDFSEPSAQSSDQVEKDDLRSICTSLRLSPEGRAKIDHMESHIIIVSKQLIDGYVGEKRIDAISHMNLDLIIFDENHFHGTTSMSKEIFRTYQSPKTVRVYLTATYAKPLNTWNIPEECQFYWDIEDEQMCKRRDVEGLRLKHGSAIDPFLLDVETALAAYDHMPDLHIITNMMDQKRYQVIADKVTQHVTASGEVYGFSNTALLSLWKRGTSYGFNYIQEVDDVLSYISGKGLLEKEESPIRDKMAIFERIKAVSAMNGSRTSLSNGDFTSQIWFLPFGKGMEIDKVSICLKERMMKNRVLSRYEIMIVNSKKPFKLNEMKAEIYAREMKAKEEGKSGLILLAGNQLTLGITLPLVDVVLLLNDASSNDRVTQMMYRAMTEAERKKMGFVVDLNISRVLNTILDFGSYSGSVEEKIRYVVEHNLIHMDVDLFQTRENKSNLIERLTNVWRENPTHNIKRLLKSLDEYEIEFQAMDQIMISQYFAPSGPATKKSIVKTVFDEESPEQVLPSGITVRRIQEEGKEGKEAEMAKVSFVKDILPYAIPLCCILTIHDKCFQLDEIIETIQKNRHLSDVYCSQAKIWWGNEDTLHLMKYIIRKYVDKKSFIHNIVLQFKMSLQSLIDTPDKLLEYIQESLKPKQKEKEENGEVFTPMTVINEMLDNLDAHYTATKKHSIFTEAGFKWGDIAGCGMGNFSIAIYLRLIEGLKAKIPDLACRKRHIIENMLYMAEFNKKNIQICRQIFDLGCEYNLHLFEGDALTLDPKKTWGVDNFDVIIGNPPYNKDGIQSHTGKHLDKTKGTKKTPWPLFIKHAFTWLKSDGYLAFINPLSWLKNGREKTHNSLLEKHIVWMKLWDNSQSKSIIQADIPISLYIVHNRINTSKEPTKITSILRRKKVNMTVNEYLDKKYSIPLAYYSIFRKLSQFIEANKAELDAKTNTIKDAFIINPKVKLPIPKEYDLDDMWAVDTYTFKDGLLGMRTTERHPDADKRKLIISNKSSTEGMFIDEGRIGLVGNHKFYILGDRLELLERMIKFPIIGIVIQYTKYGQDFVDTAAFKYIPDIRKIAGLKDSTFTEEEFHKLLKLTPAEIEQIKNATI